eukprot:scaffold52251_cov47-Attheya_sp.AAC.4
MLTHLSTDWQAFFADRESNSSTNKKMSGLKTLFHDGLTPKECAKILLDEDDTIFMTINPITKRVELSHHFHVFGGTRLQPEALYAALVGFDPEAQAVMIDPGYLFDSQQLRAPTLASLNACKNKDDLLALVEPAPDVVLVGAESGDDEAEPEDKFEEHFTRMVVVIPPFLANEWVDNDSRDPLELLLQAQAAIFAFDTLHQGNALIPNAGLSMLHVLQFLWAAHHKRPNGVPLLVTTEPTFDAWRVYLHKTCIIPSVNATSPFQDAIYSYLKSWKTNLKTSFEDAELFFLAHSARVSRGGV